MGDLQKLEQILRGKGDYKLHCVQLVIPGRGTCNA
jgi:hypothetical protein